MGFSSQSQSFLRSYSLKRKIHIVGVRIASADMEVNSDQWSVNKIDEILFSIVGARIARQPITLLFFSNYMVYKS